MLDKYAILVDNLFNNQQTAAILQEILSKPQYDVTIFSIVKENILPNPLPVFSIAEYFNWNGVTIITSDKTFEKTLYYPTIGPKIIIGNLKYPEYLNIEKFDLDLIKGIIDDNSKLTS